MLDGWSAVAGGKFDVGLLVAFLAVVAPGVVPGWSVAVAVLLPVVTPGSEKLMAKCVIELMDIIYSQV